MLYIFSLTIFLILSNRLIGRLELKPRSKFWLNVLLFIITQKYLINSLFGNSPFAPEIPSWFLLTSGWLFGAAFLLLVLVLSKDLLFFLCGIISHSLRLTLDKYLPHTPLVALFAVVALTLSAYGTYEATRTPDIKPMEITLKRLPPALDGLKIALITDLHASPLQNAGKVQAIVDKVNSTQPDLILMAGDFIDGSVSNRNNDVAPLAHLQAKYAVLGAPGNHEYYSDYDRWMDKLEELHIQMLSNAHVTLTINGEQLVIAGVTDDNADRFQKPLPNIDYALAGTMPSVPRILLAHQPKGADNYAQAQVDLQVSGHTHGGMIKGFDALIAQFNRGYVRGLYQVGQMQLYVSPGTGLWGGLPLRLGVPSEITLITLRAPSTKN